MNQIYSHILMLCSLAAPAWMRAQVANDSCTLNAVIFQHFEYDTQFVYFYNFAAGGVETVQKMDMAMQLSGPDTIRIDTSLIYDIVSDSLLVSKKQDNTLVLNQTLPAEYWQNKTNQSGGIPLLGAYRVIKIDSFWYFLWIQWPSQSWPGKVWINKSNEQFEALGSYFVMSFSSMSITSFVNIHEQLIGLEINSFAGQNQGTTILNVFDIDLNPVVQFTNPGQSNSAPGAGLIVLPNRRFAYYEGFSSGQVFQLSSGTVRNYQYQVFGIADNLPVPISRLDFEVFRDNTDNYSLNTFCWTQRDTIHYTKGFSTQTSAVNPLYLTDNPNAGPYYGIDTLQLIANDNSNSAQKFVSTTFADLAGVVEIMSNYIVVFRNGKVSKVNCATSAVTQQPDYPTTKLYPNPFFDRANIVVEDIGQESEFQLMDVWGRVVFRADLLDYTTAVKIPAHLTAGLYFWTVNSPAKRGKVRPCVLIAE